MYRAKVITISDRASSGVYADESGPLASGILRENGFEAGDVLIIPDEEERIYESLTSIADSGSTDVIFTTGGTGFSKRDVTPEATVRACDRMAPGIAEAVRAMSLEKTKNAMLSRAVAGIRGETLIINLPGSKKAVRECLEFVLPVLPHGIGILKGEADG